MIAGGAQQITLDLIRHLDKKNFDIHIISGIETGKEGSLWHELTELLPEDRVHKVPSLVRNVSPLKDIRAYFQIKRILKSIVPDIVHTHTSKAGIQGRVAAHTLGIKKIIHSTHGLIYNTEAQIPGVSGRKILTELFKKAERYAGKVSHHLITLSEIETGEALHMRLAPPKAVQAISNGIDLSAFSKIPQEPDKWKGAQLRLGIAGRLNKEKGHDVLLACFESLATKYPNIELKIAGDGPLLPELQSKVKKMKLDERIHFLGYQDDIADFLSKIDIFVLSSHYEGFGLVLVEAMAAGLPIVATDVGGVREVVSDGETGIIVPPGSISELCLGIEYFIQNPNLAYEYGQKGRVRSNAKFSVSKMVKEHEKLYLEKEFSSPQIEFIENSVQVDLHMHSSYSFDSKTKLEEIFEKAKEEQVQCIAITDHDTIEGAMEAKKMAPENLNIIPGIEVTSDIGDIIGLFVDKPILSKHFKEVIAEIKAQNGIVYLPHPFRGRRSISLELIDLVDVIEVYNGRSQGINYEDDSFGNQDIVNFAKTYSKTGIGSSDAHKSHEVARVTTSLPSFQSDEELKKILLSQRIFPVMADGKWVPETLTEHQEAQHI